MGVVLWEVLTGRRLFTGKAFGSAPREIAEMPIPIPSTYNRDVAPALDTVVMRALERDPKKRYQTARELGLALERVLAEAGHSVPAAHVADWLEELSPGRAIEKRGIRAMAQAMGTALNAPSVAPRGSSAARRRTRASSCSTRTRAATPTGSPRSRCRSRSRSRQRASSSPSLES